MPINPSRPMTRNPAHPHGRGPAPALLVATHRRRSSLSSALTRTASGHLPQRCLLDPLVPQGATRIERAWATAAARGPQGLAPPHPAGPSYPRRLRPLSQPPPSSEGNRPLRGIGPPRPSHTSRRWTAAPSAPSASRPWPRRPLRRWKFRWRGGEGREQGGRKEGQRANGSRLESKRAL